MYTTAFGIISGRYFGSDFPWLFPDREKVKEEEKKKKKEKERKIC